MRRRTLVTLALLVVAAAAIAHRARRRSRPRPADAAAAIRAEGRAADLVPRSHYRLAYQQDIAVGAQPPIHVAIDGEWITTPRRDGRLEVRFAPAAIDAPDGTLPAAADLAAPMQLVHQGGVLAAIGFPRAMPGPARALLTTLATTVQLTDRADARWTITEEDVLGRYDASYSRSGGAIARSRVAYASVRGERGLSVPAAAGVTAAERSRFTVDPDGLVTAAVEIERTIAIGDGVAPARLRTRASLERTAIEWVPAPIGPAFPAGPISDFSDHEVARKNADEARFAGATLTQLLDELVRAAGLDAGVAGTGQERAHAVSRLAAYIRLHPEAAAQVAGLLRAHGADRAETELLAGALSSARVAEATDALAGLVDVELPAAARTNVVNALTLSEPVTARSLAALGGVLDGGDAAQAALALGAHSRQAPAALAGQAHEAVEALLARQAAATSPAERTILVQALGNSGSPEALPRLRTVIAGGDADLAGAAVFSLRFIGGAEADALLSDALADPALAFGAVRAIAYRDPDQWRDRLHALADQYRDRNDILSAVHGILRRWG